jgi:D-glucosaminate-6-phosphate ammonia-lyase
MKRRRVLQAVAAVAGAPSLGAAASGIDGGSVYTRLGVKPLINGMGTVTVVGGSLMPPEVVRAMEEASRHFVFVPDLQKKAGARIAELLDVPGAMVTAGAASAIAVATAAAMTRGDQKKISQLPDTTGLPFEVIQQKSHRCGYEPQILLNGAKIVTVETREDLDRAIGERTAMMFFLNKAEPDGQIKSDEWVRVAKERGVVSFNDAAADVPPREHLSRYLRQGFDLVAFSGGKGLRGPQCSGLLLGRKDLIDGAHTCISPFGGIGRGMKVGKEEKQVHEQLQAGDPPIHVLLTGPGKLTVSVWMMRGDEHRVVARRLRDILAAA